MSAEIIVQFPNSQPYRFILEIFILNWVVRFHCGSETFHFSREKNSEVQLSLLSKLFSVSFTEKMKFNRSCAMFFSFIQCVMHCATIKVLSIFTAGPEWPNSQALFVVRVMNGPSKFRSAC